MLDNIIEYKRFVWQLNNCIDFNKNIVFVCLGTTAIIGDSFGPVVGSVLRNKLWNNKVKILGDLQNCITYNNIQRKMIEINNKYADSIIIVIDSALANKSNIGKIFVQNRGLKYAESLMKKNCTIGNISIKAVVGEYSTNNFKNFHCLKNVSLQRIEQVSAIVANGILEVMNKKENTGKNIYKL